jgi:PST family polysaccharide transporter
MLLYTRIDLVMLKELSSPEQVGYFAASSRLAQLWVFIQMVLVNATFPMLARLRVSDSAIYAQKSRDLFFILSVSGLILALALTLGSSFIVPKLLGNQYTPTIPMLGVQGWIAMCYFVRTGVDRWMVTEHLTLYSLLLHASTALLNIALNWVLIPRWGGFGSALASLIAMAIALWVMPWCFASLRPLARLLLPIRVPDWRGLLRSHG